MGLNPLRPRESSPGGIVLPGELVVRSGVPYFGDRPLPPDFVSVAKWCVVPDCKLSDGANSGTDWQTQLQAGINELPAGSVIYFPEAPWGYAYKTGPLTCSKPMSFRGAHRRTSVLCPAPTIGADEGVINFTFSGSEPTNEFNHLQHPQIHELGFDGFDRTVPCAAVVLSRVDRALLRSLYILGFDGPGLWLERSVRESVFDAVYVRYCGDGVRGGIEISELSGSSIDAHNNNYFMACEVPYAKGPCVRIVSDGTAAGGIRGIFFHAGLYHGTTSEPDEGYPETNKWPLFELQNAANIHVVGARVHASGPGHPLFRLHGSASMAHVTSCSIGGTGTPDPATGVDITSNVFTIPAHGFGVGARVVVDGGGLTDEERYVIPIDDDTFSVATSLANAIAGTVETVSDDNNATVTVKRAVIYLAPGLNRATLTGALVSNTWEDAICNRSGTGGYGLVAQSFGNINVDE